MVLIGSRKPVSRRAHLIEFGTSKMAAQPFMRPATKYMAARNENRMVDSTVITVKNNDTCSL